MREKLIELIQDGTNQCSKIFCKECEHFTKLAKCKANIIADHLITHGVTVQEWISVKDRLPDKDTLVLCIGSKGGMFLGYVRFLYGDDTTAYTRVPNSRSSRQTEYWMPLPEPPKGE